MVRYANLEMKNGVYVDSKFASQRSIDRRTIGSSPPLRAPKTNRRSTFVKQQVLRCKNNIKHLKFFHINY